MKSYLYEISFFQLVYTETHTDKNMAFPSHTLDYTESTKNLLRESKL